MDLPKTVILVSSPTSLTENHKGYTKLNKKLRKITKKVQKGKESYGKSQKEEQNNWKWQKIKKIYKNGTGVKFVNKKQQKQLKQPP